MLATMPMNNAYYRRSIRRKYSPLSEWRDDGTIPNVKKMLKAAPAQLKSYEFIDDYKSRHNGNPPTRQLIADHLRCSKQRVDQLIAVLEEKELIILDELLRPMIPWGEYSEVLV